MLALVVKTIPVRIAYAIRAGPGIVLVSIAAAMIYRQHLDLDLDLDLPAMLGMTQIIAGVAVIQLLFGSTGH